LNESRTVCSRLSGGPRPFEVADGPVRLDAALTTAHDGQATAIEAVDPIL